MQTYTAYYVTDEGDTVTKLVELPEDILLAYCLAYDACNYPVRETIEAVATGNEPLQDAILALHARFDLQEDFTPQLLRERESYQCMN